MNRVKSEMQLPPPDAMARIFKALGHPTRLAIIAHLMEVETCFCKDIVHRFPHSQSTISQHLKLLRESGIIQGQILGAKSQFRVDREMLARLKSFVTQL